MGKFFLLELAGGELGEDDSLELFGAANSPPALDAIACPDDEGAAVQESGEQAGAVLD
jgi:hypothetical protein